MREKTGLVLMWMTLVSSVAAGAASFAFLYRLGNDPLPELGARFKTAAFLQLVPFVAASVLAVCLRRRPDILIFSIAAVIGCGLLGGWWLSGIADDRRAESASARHRDVGDLFPNLGGQVGSLEAMIWPSAEIVVIGGATMIGWAASRTKRRISRPASIT